MAAIATSRCIAAACSAQQQIQHLPQRKSGQHQGRDHVDAPPPADVEPLAQAAPALLDLQAALGQALQRCGLRVESRAFKPHVTLARRAARATLAAPSAPQRWPVSAYALVASAGGRYRNLALYRGGMLSATADPAPATTQIRPAPRPRPR
ncbi:MAG TPA: 2'-5' RNA ligase family protein [Burkholderiaceae bacterium]|nr:2'-5' RNA ligase family protein [Burkholderiaceae bacterium]